MYVKRFLDFVMAFFLLVLLSPLLLLVSVVVYLNFGFPVLFRQQRPGLHGQSFVMFKFRSMRNDIDTEGNLLANELRMTRFSQWLRSTSLDELPTLWNVLKGDMSLVGPRPLLVEYLPLYTHRQGRRHEVKPGVTGWAQVNGRNAITWEEKFELDVWYVDHRSLGLDLHILMLTLRKVLRREGIAHAGDVSMPRFRGSSHE
ncbi:lipopolysaccharide/colanic/teichoic acid biosynthesis glycosyltransferase [Halomonas ventosae]|uniref:Lipopolysaccharide/colanic/teichoic acid biosynthesis glycosyltransferase n=1 Tax=Halomonas ventosae TaxID=229007 RepID=A0A4R6ZWH5_9GAMM|nr:sugar transferase [Halomonas ventosae]TDR57291.1 lipopolysaccharide/colanic/teichoic acid biosynthesis glycosyltransferase [Halomonas ventosae]